jgi:hypothetical protein
MAEAQAHASTQGPVDTRVAGHDMPSTTATAG